jgi:hypothetical protein
MPLMGVMPHCVPAPEIEMSTAGSIIERLIAWYTASSTPNEPALGFYAAGNMPPWRLIQQSLVELELYIDVLQGLSPRTIALEIGFDRGGTHFVWRQLFDQVISIESNYWCCCKGIVEFPGAESKIIYGGSGNSETTQVLTDILGGRTVDHLFVDGNHEYEAVRGDFLAYAPFVRSGGIIGFHDAHWKEAAVVEFLHDLRHGGVPGWPAVDLKEIHYGQGRYATGISYLRIP